MEGLHDLEQAVLDKLLAGDQPALATLREQARYARIRSHERTGAGFFIAFEVPACVPTLHECADFHLGDVDAIVEGLKNGAGFVIFVRDGRLHALEGYSYEEPWPDDARSFRLVYHAEPRKLGRPDTSAPR